MLRPAWRRNAAASMRSCRWRGLCADCFKGQWELPYRQIPWALPFQISKAEATDAFHSWLSTDLHRLAELSVFAVRPVYVPYYVFVGQLKATFDGVVAYGETEYALRGIKCPAVHLGADAGRTTGVYAGFDSGESTCGPRCRATSPTSSSAARSPSPRCRRSRGPGGRGVPYEAVLRVRAAHPGAMRRPIRSLSRRPPRLHLRRLPEQERAAPLAQPRGGAPPRAPGARRGRDAATWWDGRRRGRRRWRRRGGRLLRGGRRPAHAPSAEARPPSYTR